MTGGRLERLLPLSGVLFSVVMLVGFFITGNTPDTTASAEEVLKTYDDGKYILGFIGLGLGAIFFIFFAAALRKRLVATGPEWLATLGFAGAVLFVVGLAGFATSQFALIQAAKDKNLQVAQTLNYIDNNNFPPAVIGIAVIMLATAWHVLSTRSLPRWLGWVTLVLGIVALAGPLGFLAFLATMPWTVIVAIVLYRQGSASVSPAAA